MKSVLLAFSLLISSVTFAQTVKYKDIKFKFRQQVVKVYGKPVMKFTYRANFYKFYDLESNKELFYIFQDNNLSNSTTDDFNKVYFDAAEVGFETKMFPKLILMNMIEEGVFESDWRLDPEKSIKFAQKYEMGISSRSRPFPTRETH